MQPLVPRYRHAEREAGAERRESGARRASRPRPAARARRRRRRASHARRRATAPAPKPIRPKTTITKSAAPIGNTVSGACRNGTIGGRGRRWRGSGRVGEVGRRVGVPARKHLLRLWVDLVVEVVRERAVAVPDEEHDDERQRGDDGADGERREAHGARESRDSGRSASDDVCRPLRLGLHRRECYHATRRSLRADGRRPARPVFSVWADSPVGLTRCARRQVRDPMRLPVVRLITYTVLSIPQTHGA